MRCPLNGGARLGRLPGSRTPLEPAWVMSRDIVEDIKRTEAGGGGGPDPGPPVAMILQVN